MTSTARIPRTKITGAYGAVIKLFMRKMMGGVPESAEIMWNHPAAFKDMMKFGGRTEKWDRLDRNLATFAVMASAAEIGCSFCLDFNYFLAHNKGLDEAKVRQVPQWRTSTAFTPPERRVMEYAVAATQTPPAVTDEMSAALLADLGADGLIELTARIGMMNMTARSNVSLGIQSEEYAESCGLQPLAPTKHVASAS